MKKKKPIVITILAIIGVSLIIYGIYAFGLYKMFMKFSNMTQPPTTVSATYAEQTQWQPRIEAVGSLRAVQGVDVANEVAGRVEKILFESGKHVEKGDLLVQLDDSIEQAQLPGAKAQLELARSNYERTQKLVKQGLASEEQLDSAQSQLKQAQSALESLQATLSKKAVRAPFSGTLGIRQVDIGQYLAPGTTIVTLQNLDALYADFALPEQYLGKVKAGQTVQLSTAVASDKTFTGKVSAVSIKLDPSTRNFTVRATIENPQHILHPGMFANLAVLAGEPVSVVSIPEASVSYSLYGDAVYLITKKQPEDNTSTQSGSNNEKADKKAAASQEPILIATQTFVELGESRHGDIAVIKGVQPGDRVVTAGQLKLQRESRVVINNTVKLD